MNQSDYRKDQGEAEDRCPHGVAFDQPENECPTCAEAYALTKEITSLASRQLMERTV